MTDMSNMLASPLILRLMILLLVVKAIDAESITIESAADLACVGGAGFSTYGGPTNMRSGSPQSSSPSCRLTQPVKGKCVSQQSLSFSLNFSLSHTRRLLPPQDHQRHFFLPLCLRLRLFAGRVPKATLLRRPTGVRSLGGSRGRLKCHRRTAGRADLHFATAGQICGGQRCAAAVCEHCVDSSAAAVCVAVDGSAAAATAFLPSSPWH